METMQKKQSMPVKHKMQRMQTMQKSQKMQLKNA